MKKSKLPPIADAPEQNPSPYYTPNFPNLPQAPSEELQKYYNAAYVREKQRFNSIFGIIEEDNPVEKHTIYVDPPADEYVHIEEHVKVKGKAKFWRFTTLFFFLASIVLAIVVVIKS